ncbi:hypothetical protein OIU76_003130 [Salix suchowensis]|nr:hypothetical protein OIU76_003130 [Salix suchowensis]
MIARFYEFHFLNAVLCSVAQSYIGFCGDFEDCRILL